MSRERNAAAVCLGLQKGSKRGRERVVVGISNVSSPEQKEGQGGRFKSLLQDDR